MVAALESAPGPRRVELEIAHAASVTGMDFGFLLQQARIESALDPQAQAKTSSAAGLYQFIEQSWLGVIAAHGDAAGLGWAADSVSRGRDGRYRIDNPAMRSAVLDLRKDPAAAARMAAYSAADNKTVLERRLGHSVEAVDLYLAHFLGAGGATKFLRAWETDPEAPAAALFPRAAGANRAVFYDRDGSERSVAEVRARFAARFETGPTPDAPVTSIQRYAGAPPTHGGQSVRLAYLMLASLGV